MHCIWYVCICVFICVMKMRKVRVVMARGKWLWGVSTFRHHSAGHHFLLHFYQPYHGEYLVLVGAKENVLMDAKEIVSVEAKRNVVLWGQGKIYLLFLTKIKNSSLNCSIHFICQQVSGFEKISFHKISADFKWMCLSSTKSFCRNLSVPCHADHTIH